MCINEFLFTNDNMNQPFITFNYVFWSWKSDFLCIYLYICGLRLFWNIKLSKWKFSILPNKMCIMIHIYPHFTFPINQLYQCERYDYYFPFTKCLTVHSSYNINTLFLYRPSYFLLLALSHYVNTNWNFFLSRKENKLKMSFV